MYLIGGADIIIRNLWQRIGRDSIKQLRHSIYWQSYRKTPTHTAGLTKAKFIWKVWSQ